MRTLWPSATAFVATLVIYTLFAGICACVSNTPTLHVLATFDARNRALYTRVLQKSLNEVTDDPEYPFKLVAISLGVAGDVERAPREGLVDSDGVDEEQMDGEQVAPTPDILHDLCNVLDDNNVTVALVLAMGEGTTSLAAALVGGAAGLPVLGFPAKSTIYAYNAYKDLNPYFQALSPSVESLAEALAALLLANVWLTSTMVTDDTGSSIALGKALIRHLSQAEPHAAVLPVALSKGTNESRPLAETLGFVVRQRGRVVILHCEASLASLIFEHAAKLGMLSGDYVWLVTGGAAEADPPVAPIGSIALRIRRQTPNKHLVRAAARTFVMALRDVWHDYASVQNIVAKWYNCWYPPTQPLRELSSLIARKLENATMAGVAGRLRIGGASGSKAEAALRATFDIFNLVSRDGRQIWRSVGNVTRGNQVTLDAVVWPGGTIIGPASAGRARLRVVTALAPPFVMAVEVQPNGACIRGVPCLRVASKKSEGKNEELAEIVAAFEASTRTEVTGSAWAAWDAASDAYNVSCCAGFAVDLLVMVARDGGFDFVLYVAADGKFGARIRNAEGEEQWNGVIGDVISGAAHLAFAPLSATGDRNRRVDFSVPFFFSGVSFLASTKPKQVPLLAFLSPFSWGLWVCIFAGLNATAFAAAVYEWLSPFGLNPWGRQRTKNFSLASALWVTWSLLFSHLVAFKAPKSWPNKVLINLWGCFSVIFLASYTANIAALFAGFFGEMTDENFHDEALLSQRVGTVRSSAVETFIGSRNIVLRRHMQRYGFDNLEEGIRKLRDGELDLMIGDAAILDYYRRKDPGCGFRRVGPTLYEDTYAIAMGKGSPLQENITLLITRYNEYGYLDQLTEMWFGGPPCFRNPSELYSPLSVHAVAGVFIMLIVGMVIGCLILLMEHIVYKHGLPKFRQMPKGTLWRSPNLMFFSQKLYRFINCVELVSPHHSAKELVKNLRTGQITSLFQKSIKRKENEQRRRRKSKAQFFEMIQEIRRVQKQEKTCGTSVWDEKHSQIRGKGPEVSLFSPSGDEPDDTCAFLIEHMPASTIPELLEPCSSSSSCVSSDDENVPSANMPQSITPLIAAVACSSLLSASVAELYPSRTQPPLPPQRINKVPSYDDLKSWEDADMLDGDSHHGHRASRFSMQRGDHSHCIQHPQMQWSTRSRNNFMPELPLTKHDFYDLPPRLNDARLQRLTKDDLVFLWQCCERDLRRRLKQALKEKCELEARLKYHLASSSDQAVLHPP